jgi:hypothetical protein
MSNTDEKVSAELTRAELEAVLKRRAQEQARQKPAAKPFREWTPEEQANYLRRRGVFNG